MNVSFAGTYLGGKSYGWAEKEFYGNQNSGDTIAIIIGVHPREYQFHEAIAAALRDKSGNLSKKYVLYRVHVTKNAWHYRKGRMNGQLIANKFVVPDVIRTNPKLAIDIHECMWRKSGYRYGKFVDPISKNRITRNYANIITQKMPFLKIYSPKGTSPKYVTKPISRKGIPTLLYETYKLDSYDNKYSDASQLIDVLDRL